MGFSLTRRALLKAGAASAAAPATVQAELAQGVGGAVADGATMTSAFESLYRIIGWSREFVVHVTPPKQLRHRIEYYAGHLERLAQFRPTAEQLLDIIDKHHPSRIECIFGSTRAEDVTRFAKLLESAEGRRTLLQEIVPRNVRSTMDDIAREKARERAMRLRKRMRKIEQPVPADTDFPVVGTNWQKRASPIPHDYYDRQPANSWHERLVEQQTELSAEKTR